MLIQLLEVIWKNTSMEWGAKISNGEIHEYVTNGIKPPEEFEDDIESAFVWLWSFKDYAKDYATSKKLSGNWVESKVNDDFRLCLSADIANKAKHGNLKSSRSEVFPCLGSLKYTLPHGSFNEIRFYTFKVETDVSKPEEAILAMDVIDNTGKRIDDAFELLDYSLKAWEDIMKQLDAMGI